MIQGASSLAPTSLPNPVVVILYSAFVVTIVTTFETVMCAFKAVFGTFLQVKQSWGRGGGAAFRKFAIGPRVEHMLDLDLKRASAVV